MPRVEDMGLGDMERALHTLQAAGNVAVGIQGADASAVHKSDEGEDDSPLTNVEIGAIHEYGLGVPQRSFLGDTLDLERPDLDQACLAIAKSVMEGRITVNQAQDVLGTFHVQQIKARILTGINPPNAPATIEKKKGKTTPLVNTGQLLSAITWAREGAA